MCYFYSFLSVNGKFFFPKYEERQEMLKMKLFPDGHPDIIEYYQSKGELGLKRNIEDISNKYEYNPFTKKLFISKINGKDDSQSALKLVSLLNFSEVEPNLVYKEILDYSEIDITQEFHLYKTEEDYYEYAREYVWNLFGGDIWNTLNKSIPKKEGKEFQRIKYLLTFIKGE